MPRKLPWLQESSSSTVTKRPVKSSVLPKKRSKIQDVSGSDIGNSDGEVEKRKRKDRTRTPLSSPPPEPPLEKFMDEGLDHDDKYRMVEDEFLSVAKQFTVHLHTAEYHRQRKLAKSKNAETISSISRPVTQKMPDQTRRKTESVNRSKTQRIMLQGLLRQPAKPEDSDDSTDGDALPYVGTTLHGLMDSPRRRAASLAKVGTMATTTRAAAGFQKPAAHLRQGKRKASESPQSKIALQRTQGVKDSHDVTESSDEDDDLDAPIAAPKLVKLSSSRLSCPVSKSTTKSGSFGQVQQQATVISKTVETKSISSRPVASLSGVTSKAEEVKTENSTTSDNVLRIRKRLAQARIQKAEEKKDHQKKHLDIIPTFL